MSPRRKAPAVASAEAPDVVTAGRVDALQNAVKTNSFQAPSWRDVLPVHPAADLFPMMSTEELKELAKDVAEHGLREPVVLFEVPASPLKLKRHRGTVEERVSVAVLDGRNRLAALEANGHQIDAEGLRDCAAFGITHLPYKDGVRCPAKFIASYADDDDFDPVAYVISANIHRRHLTADQRRELIAKRLKANPTQSNRQIAEQVKADDKTVGKVRKELQATAEIPQLAKTTGKDGRTRTSTPKKPVEVVPVPLAPCTDGMPEMPSFLRRNKPTEAVAVRGAITVEMIKAALVRFKDFELDDLRSVVDAEIEARRSITRVLS